MNSSRKLTLRKETLSELTTDELRAVVGAATDGCGITKGGLCDDLSVVPCIPTCGNTCTNTSSAVK